MMLRTLLLPLALLLPACSPDAIAPDEATPPDDIRAIHIARNGVPVDSLLRTGTLGSIGFELLIEGRDGTLRSQEGTGASWGSTHPSVIDEIFRDGREVYLFRQQDGRARVIAELGSFRDTVTVEIRQVASAVRFRVDTLVTFAPGARDVTGAPTAYHTMRFGAQRIDSGAFPVASTLRIDYASDGAAPFELFPDARGDSISIAGTEVGSGDMVVRFAGREDTIPVQVAGAYRLVRLTELPGRAPRPVPLPPSITIRSGTAIIFRNETGGTAEIGDRHAGTLAWTTGPIQPGGVEAQLFSVPGYFHVSWAGASCIIIVGP